jgi:hypothetical protein
LVVNGQRRFGVGGQNERARERQDGKDGFHVFRVLRIRFEFND